MCWNLPLRVMVKEGKPWEGLGPDSKALMNGISAIMKEASEGTFSHHVKLAVKR